VAEEKIAIGTPFTVALHVVLENEGILQSDSDAATVIVSQRSTAEVGVVWNVNPESTS